MGERIDMRCLIAGDKKLELWKLKRMVKKITGKEMEIFLSCKESETIKIFNNAIAENVDYIEIVIIDVEMSHGRGYFVAEKIRRISPETNIIIMADSDRYALDTFKIYVSDYLIKPIKKSDLKDALDHLRYPVY